jgi:hypothetical protein
MDDAQLLKYKLVLAAERVTGDDLIAKRQRKDALLGAAIRITGWQKSGPSAPQRPAAAELRALLGDPDQKEIREALDRWDTLEWQPPAADDLHASH